MGREEYAFFAIEEVVVPVWVSSMSQIDLFDNCSYPIGSCAKKKKKLKLEM